MRVSWAVIVREGGLGAKRGARRVMSVERRSV